MKLWELYYTENGHDVRVCVCTNDSDANSRLSSFSARPLNVRYLGDVSIGAAAELMGEYDWSKYLDLGADVFAADNQLPALVGTANQISWAMTIRHTAIKKLLSYDFDLDLARSMAVSGQTDDIMAYINDPETDPDIASLTLKSIKIFSEQSAKWWIDNRN